MDESRGRFDKAAAMIVRALRTGVMEGNGKYYPQPRTEIRPRPKHSFDSRIYAVASSDDSVEAAARLGAQMVMFADRPWPMRLPAIQKTRSRPPDARRGRRADHCCADFCVCTPKQERRRSRREVHGQVRESNFEHYELLGDHFNTVKGYDAYAQKAAIAKAVGMDGIGPGS